MPVIAISLRPSRGGPGDRPCTYEKLTYMSIAALVRDRLDRGMLRPLIPKAAGTSPRRAMLVTEDVWLTLSQEYEDGEMEDRMGTLQADLELFAEGQPVDPKYLFLLYPTLEGVWEIRSMRPQPSIRVLGLFAMKDVFIATNLEFRENLGGWQSREWKNCKRLARTRWTNLFHTYRPIISTNVHHLVSDATDGKYFKA